MELVAGACEGDRFFSSESVHQSTSICDLHPATDPLVINVYFSTLQLQATQRSRKLTAKRRKMECNTIFPAFSHSR